MLARLLGIFIIVMILELALLMRLGQAIGFWPTFALVVVSGAAGLLLARSQGMKVLNGIRTEISVGQMPSTRLLDGLMVMLGGALLLLPGLLTDIAGLGMLLPWSRNRLQAALRRRVERMIRSGAVTTFMLRR